MIPTATADKILAAKKCGGLFSKADKATVVLEYRKLAKEFHPDVCPLPNAEDVFKHLSKLYEEALDLLAQGQWEISNVVSIRDNCGKTYQGRYLKTFQFELGVAYVADLSVTYILDKQNKRFFDNAINQIGALKYANPNMEEEFSRYLPKIKHQFETRDGQYCLILDKTPDVFLLSDILAYYKNSIPDRHAAWIISRLCNLCCYFDYLGMAHNGLTLQNCFISPTFHTVLPLGGWWYAQQDGNKMLGVPKAIYDIMPVKAKSNKTSSKRTDLEAAKLIGRQITDKSSAPKPMLDFLSSGTSTAIGEFEKWNKALDASYGKRQFVEMKIGKMDIYKS